MAESLGWDAWFTAGVVMLMVGALVREAAQPYLVLLGCLGLLLVAGVLPPDVAFSGFSNSAVLAIASLFVVAAGVQRTEALTVFDRLLFGRSRAMPVVLLRLMGPTALLSSLVNNTPLVAMLIPRVQHWARREGVAASKLLIPLSYASVLGGMITLIGTSTNLVVSGLLQQATGAGLHFFDLTWVGLPAACVGMLYVSLVGHRFLPSNRQPDWRAGRSLKPYHFELRVGARAPAAGRTIEEAGLRGLDDAYLMQVRRGRHTVGPVSPAEVLLPDDVLVFSGDAALIDPLMAGHGLERVVEAPSSNGVQRLPLFEAVVAASSTLVGKTLKEVGFRERFQGVVLALQRRSRHLAGPLGQTPIEAGDLLLIEARPGFDRQWNAMREDFYLVAPALPEEPAGRTRRAPVALLILGGMVLASAFGVVPLVTAAFLAALTMIATGCLSLAEARQAVDLPLLLMIGAALGVGAALTETGLAGVAAQGLLQATVQAGPFIMLLAVYLLTNLLTELLTNAAAAALVFPIALATAHDLNLDPVPFAVVVAVAASAGFSTPFGYQTNLMVMGAGGYRFMDYFKAGFPLNVLVMAVALLCIWLVWL